MARVVIVSNRVVSPELRTQTLGGLAPALRDTTRRTGGVWIGWSGQVADGAEEPMIAGAGKTTYVTVDLTPEEYEKYYLGYANEALWPLLHYRLGLVHYEQDAFEAYLQVNARFARIAASLLHPDDAIWVHDYHLIPLGACLRALGITNRIGFFLHTPFPSFDVLSALPHYERLVSAMAAYDLVGFQTAAARDAFLGCVAATCGGKRVGDAEFRFAGRSSKAAVFPIGIDAASFAVMAAEAVASSDVRRLQASLAGRPLVVGVDRLDYSKGIPQRIAAIERLLTLYPEQRRRFNYLQIAPHSRAELRHYRAIRRELERMAGRTNGRFAEFDWSPLRYVNKSFSQQALAGLYRAARVGLVTPLRDGMNLVAKEFVAAQDPQDPGVLILSRFAGAAQELQGALIVNPIDATEMAAALHRALTMPVEDRQRRWRAMMDANLRNTVEHWQTSFLSALQRRPGLEPGSAVALAG